jgi:outer membrane usher protein
VRRPAPAARRWAPALALALSLGALAQPAEDQRAFLELIVNDAPQDATLVRLRGTDGTADALVAVQDLERAGLRGLRGAREQHEGREYVSLLSLAPEVQFKVDSQALALHLTARPELLQATQLDLRTLQRPADMVFHADTSAFFNYSATATAQGQYSGALELGGSYRGDLVYTGANVAPDGRVVRGLSNLTLDSPQDLRRIVVGDSFAGSSGLGGSLILGGVSVTREYALDPYFVRQPLPRLSGAILSPSVLDVYVNGALVRQEAIAPGRFEVRNLPVTNGAGQVSYVVRDSFGRTQEYTSAYYGSPGLLAPGLSDYGYNLGLRRLDFGIAGFSYGPPALLARHRVGITEQLTAGFRVEAALQHVRGWDEPSCATCASLLTSGGPSASIALPFGELDLEAAVSSDGREVGGAATAGYSLLTRRLMVNVAARAFTPRFANLSMGATSDRSALGLRGTVGVPLTSRLSLALDGSLDSMRDAGLASAISLRGEARIGADLMLLATVSRLRNAPNAPEWGAAVSLLYNFGVGVSGDTSGHASTQRSGGSAGVQKSLPFGEGFGYQLRSTVEGALPVTGFGQVAYQGPYGTYTGAYMRNGAVDSGSLTAAGALVLVDGALMASRPVQDSYAIVSVPGLEGVRGFLNNQEVGRTDWRGYLLVPRLQSYYGNRVSVSDGDVPLDYEIGQTEQVIATPLRGGALVRFDVHRMQSVTGALKVEAGGRATVPAFGELVTIAGARRIASPVGAKGEFWLTDLPAGRHPAQIEFREGTCRFDLVVPEDAGRIVNLGTVSCTRLEAVSQLEM